MKKNIVPQPKQLKFQQEVSALIVRGKYEEALKKLTLRLLFTPGDNWSVREAARIHRRMGNLANAKALYHKALALAPRDPGTLNGMGLTLFDEKRYPQAERYYQTALKNHPGYSACHNNYAVLLEKMDRHTLALYHYQQAVASNPDYTDAHFSAGAILAQQGRLAEAEKVFRHVLSTRPNDKHCLNTLGMTLLKQEKYQEGWENYRARYAKNNPHRFYTLPTLPFAYWEGEDLAGKTILIRTEQGAGEEIQFCRFISRLKSEKNAARVVVMGRQKLETVMKNLAGVDQYLLSSEEMPLTDIDCWSMLLDLPRHFTQSAAPITPTMPYLKRRGRLANKWRLPAEGLKVGVVWKGSPEHPRDRDRSLDNLATLAPLKDIPGIVWVSLQQGQGESEVSEWPEMLPLGEQFEHYGDAASVLSQLDLVIGVDSPIVHLAGAMGVPCWVMLPSFARDWCWGSHQTDSQWYPETRLFIQQAGESWEEVVAHVQQALHASLVAMRPEPQ